MSRNSLLSEFMIRLRQNTSIENEVLSGLLSLAIGATLFAVSAFAFDLPHRFTAFPAYLAILGVSLVILGCLLIGGLFRRQRPGTGAWDVVLKGMSASGGGLGFGRLLFGAEAFMKMWSLCWWFFAVGAGISAYSARERFQEVWDEGASLAEGRQNGQGDGFG